MRDKVEDMKNKIFILRSFIADDGSRVAKPVYIFFFQYNVFKSINYDNYINNFKVLHNSSLLQMNTYIPK